jgi:hypothetical protein
MSAVVKGPPDVRDIREADAVAVGPDSGNQSLVADGVI